MQTAASHTPLPGRLITPEPRDGETKTRDNVYYKRTLPQRPVQLPRPRNAPQAYVPYAPAAPMRPYGRRRPQVARGDDGMMTMAIVGIVLTMVVGVPIGLFTGPAVLKRAKRLEHLVNTGRRPASERGSISSARVMAWLSIAWSIPLLIGWTAALALILASLG